MSEKLVQVTRGNLVECIHRGDAVAIDKNHKVIYSLGNADKTTYFRSSAKPLMAASILSFGVAEEFDLNNKEIALMSASHNGEDRHIRLVESMLHKGGLPTTALQCGPSFPIHNKSRRQWQRENRKKTTIANNCSGKHVGMLLACRKLNLSLDTYYELDHSLQQKILSFIARTCKVKKKDIITAIDGCGIPVFGLSLRAMAVGYTNLVHPDAKHFTAAEINALNRVSQAMTEHPEMVGGENRISTDLMVAANGRLTAKSGAEGVYCIGNRITGGALALKIEDGNSRAVAPAVISLLKKLDWLEKKQEKKLEKYRKSEIKNSKNKVVGYIESII